MIIRGYENSYVDTGKYGGTKEGTAAYYRNYPNIFANEKRGWVDSNSEGTLDLSEQNATNLVTGSTQASSKIKITQTYWQKSMATDGSDFEDEIYYNLFISNRGTYSTYWLASRCVNASSYARFGVRFVNSGSVSSYTLYYSDNSSTSVSVSVRPVVTLLSGIIVDTRDKNKDGSTASLAWELK